MTPTEIPHFNLRCVAPEGWNELRDGPCEALPVRVSNEGYCESAWLPSPAELKALEEGHAVILRVYGRQPPVAVYVEPV
jgi:hypothetical protein